MEPGAEDERTAGLEHGPDTEPPHVQPQDDPDREATRVPATSPFGITVPVPVVSDRELGIGHVGAHAAGLEATRPRAGAILSGAVTAPGVSVAPDPREPSRVTTPVLAALLWAGLAILLVAALVSAIGALGRTVYSASGFVEQYLAALQDGDASAALAMPGVAIDSAELAAAGLPADAATTLLRDSVLHGPSSSSILSDTDDGDGRHTVVASVRLGGTDHRVSFDVERNGTWAAVFPAWRFATSPIGAVAVTVQHDTTFTVNELTLDARAHAPADAAPSFDNSASYLVLTPTIYEFSRSSVQLAAEPQDVVVLKPGVTDVVIDVQPTAALVDQVQREINGFLDQCATQKVLQPTGCPFGTVIDDRVIGDPVWSIVAYPVVTITAGPTAFEVPSTTGTAHVVVEVQSLFDGDESTLDQDEPFSMGATVTLGDDGALNIQLH